MTTENARHFFEKYTGAKASELYILPKSGSSRMNFVGESSGQKFIITFNENLAENESFYYFSKIFSDLGLNTPQVLNISKDRKLYIQEFLGEKTLSEIIAEEGPTEKTRFLVEQVLRKLFEIQRKTENIIDWTKTFEYEKYDEFPITNDSFYFKSFIADVLEIPYHKGKLLKEFKKLTAILSKLEPKGLMIRDFQARNIMVNDQGEVFFIDYQSSMNGPLMYDVVSFLFQAKANFTEEFRNDMLEYYFSLWENDSSEHQTKKEKITQLKNSLKPIQLIRFLQVLGAYGFRGLIQRKEHFISSIEKGIENLHSFSENWQEMNDFPELKNLISILKSDETSQKIQTIITQ
ncbi:aminoglycoside phosphotransferase family protein [Chryseobacterium koreense]